MHVTERIEMLAAEACRRILQEIAANDAEGGLASHRSRIHAKTVRDAQINLDQFTKSAVHSQNLHNRINALLIEAGAARYEAGVIFSR